jgi:hypothetical protein
MMFIIRGTGETPPEGGLTIRLTRATPANVSGGTRDFFCDGDLDAARARKLNVVPVHDGWYADDTGGGVAIWGQGRFWEIRDTPFTVRETSADAPAQVAAAGAPAKAASDGDAVNVRQAIFGV